jgi:hypothetical protein
LRSANSESFDRASILILPRSCGQTPTSARASDDFAGSTGTDDPETLTAPQLERNIVEDQLLGAGCRDVDMIDREHFGRRRPRQGLLFLGQELQQLI